MNLAKYTKAFVVLWLVTVFFGLSASPSYAAQLAEAFLRLDRMTASTATGGTVCLKMTTTGSADAKVKVTFPTGFTVGGTAGNWTVSTSNLPLGASPMPGINTASAVASQTVTFPITDISDTSLYCFNFNNNTTLTTGTAGTDKTGTIQVTTSADAEIDVAGYATAVVGSGEDQVSITATVPSTFSFALGTNTQALGTLSTGSITSGTGVSVTIVTNASNGWVGWVKSANAALNSTVTGDSIATTGTVDDTPSQLSAGTEGYVLDANVTSGSPTIDAEYNGTGDSDYGGALSTTFTEFATASAPTASDVVTLKPRVAISGLTQAATDYTDTLTVVAAGHF